jgi:predicted PolB exonuclease-like 3'-5' exonuclease
MLIARQETTPQGLAIRVEKSGCITGPEDEIIRKFWEYFDRREPVLVTWNGRGYDLPVLRQRALRRLAGLVGARSEQMQVACSRCFFSKRGGNQ